MHAAESQKPTGAAGEAREAWQAARRLLCVRLDCLGDVLMCTPAIRALKESVAGRHVTLLSSAAGAAAAAYVAEIDDWVEYAAPWMKSPAPHDARSDRAMIELLRSRQFDAAVIFTTYSQSPLPAAMLCMLSGIPLRLAHCHENPYRLLTHWIPDPEPQLTVRHEVRRQLDLVAGVGAGTRNERLSFRVMPEHSAWARARLAESGIDGTQPWVLLHPGASAASRRYPPALWTEAAHCIAMQLHCPLVFTGSESEKSLVEEIRRAVPDHAARSHSLAGELDLGRLAAVIGMAPVLVSNNTGPAHLAAALGTPVVDLYALTNPQHTPWQVASKVLYHDVPCRNCYKSVCAEGHHACLAGVAPEQVVTAVLALLRPQAAPGDTLAPIGQTRGAAIPPVVAGT